MNEWMNESSFWYQHIEVVQFLHPGLLVVQSYELSDKLLSFTDLCLIIKDQLSPFVPSPPSVIYSKTTLFSGPHAVA